MSSSHLEDYRPVKNNEDDDSDDDDGPLWPNDASHDPDSFGKVFIAYSADSVVLELGHSWVH